MNKTLGGLVLGTFLATAMVTGTACGPESVSVYVDSGVQSDVSIDVSKDAKPDVRFDSGDAAVSFNIWPPSPGPIVRRTGPVMLGTPNIYLIWYGDWSNSKGKSITNDFFHDIDGSDWLMMSADYWMSTNVIDNLTQTRPVFVSGHVNLAQSIDVGYALGKNLGQDGAKQVVSDAITQQRLPLDTNGIYYVLTSADVQEGVWGGFCNGYCGWHDHQSVMGQDIKFVFVGDPQLQCQNGCTMQNRYEALGADHSPNDDWGTDAMLSVVAHELTETLTDPDINAWYDQSVYENADMCAWRFEPVFKTDSGSYANVHMGDHDYLIQENWVLDESGGHCALHK